MLAWFMTRRPRLHVSSFIRRGSTHPVGAIKCTLGDWYGDIATPPRWGRYGGQLLGRADCENIIKELQHGFGLSGLICKNFYSVRRSRPLAGGGSLLPHRVLSAHLGWQTTVSHYPLAELLDICHRRPCFQRCRPTHSQNCLAATATRMAKRSLAEVPVPLSQPPCSRKSTGLQVKNQAILTRLLHGYAGDTYLS